MARIPPIPIETAPAPIKTAFVNHLAEYRGRITNMKATLGHSVLAFNVYMQWYPLYEKVQRILGARLAYLFAFSISEGSNCPLCSTFFRKIIIDAGENPEHLQLTSREQLILDFGSSIAQNKGRVPDSLYQSISAFFNQEQLVLLIAFAGQMIATNVFNNVVETDLDEYLTPYTPLTLAS